MAESSDVWVLIEHRGGDSEESSLEAVAAGRELAERLERRCVAVVVESEAPTLAAKSLGAAGADVVFAVSPEPTVARSPEGLGAVLEAVVAEGDPRLLLAPGTTVMTEVATRLAVRRGAPIVPDVTSLRIGENARIAVHRPGPANRHLIRTELDDAPAVILVKPGAFAAGSDGETVAGVEHLTVQWHGPDDVRVIAVEEERADIPLERAKVIVAGGKGVGGPDGFELIRALADALGGTIGASQGAAELGWIEEDRLIGEMGTSVRPDLYIACGISGDTGHVIGMQEAGTVVTINRDPDAPIHSIADVAAVGDLHEIVPRLVDQLVEGGL